MGWPWQRQKTTTFQQERRLSRWGELGPTGLTFGGLQAADALLEDLAGLSNARISRRDALKATAVLRARNLIAGVPATLPLELRDRQRNIDDREWLGVQPNDMMEDTVTYAMTYEDLLFEATSYWRITRRGTDGFPLEAEHLDHRSVSTGVNFSMPSRIISEDLQFAPDDPVTVDGVMASRREVIRFISPNPPLLVHAAKAIRTVLLLDQIAGEYANDPLPFGYFKDATDEEPLEDDEITELLSKWERARKARRWGYVESGLDLNMLEWPSPQQLQLAEARNHAVLEIARATGLDPEDLATVVEGTSRTYQNSEDRRLALIDFTLVPYLSSVQDRLSMNDVTPRDLFARYDISAFARADFQSRMESYKTAIEAGVLTVNEVRRREDLPDAPKQLAPPPANVPPDRTNGNGRTPVGVNGNGE